MRRLLVTIAVAFTLVVISPQANAADAVLQNFPVGYGPIGLAFDGANIWVVNQNDRTVTKLRAIDGANQGTFRVGRTPLEAAYDGANIWVTNFLDDTVTKLRASDGAVLGTFPAGATPTGIAFDGTSLWIANQSANTVTKLRPSDGTIEATYNVGSNPVFVLLTGRIFGQPIPCPTMSPSCGRAMGLCLALSTLARGQRASALTESTSGSAITSAMT